jgi:hypothetical protein
MPFPSHAHVAANAFGRTVHRVEPRPKSDALSGPGEALLAYALGAALTALIALVALMVGNTSDPHPSFPTGTPTAIVSSGPPPANVYRAPRFRATPPVIVSAEAASPRADSTSATATGTDLRHHPR